MIPFASLAGLVTFDHDEVMEVSVDSLSVIGFSLRLPHGMDARSLKRVVLRWHRLRDTVEWSAESSLLNISLREQSPWWSEWQVEPEDTRWRGFARAFMEDTARYTALKSAGDDAAMAQELVRYPAEEDATIAEDFAAQRILRANAIHPDEEYRETAKAIASLGVCLSEPALWNAWLSMPEAEFRAWYWQRAGLPDHPLAEHPFSMIRIGNPFCGELFPDPRTLQELMRRQSVRKTIVLAPIREHQREAMLARLREWEQNEPIELEVNDWGMVYALRDDARFRLVAGHLPVRQRRDIRLPLLWTQSERSMLGETAGDAAFFADWLQKTMHVTGEIRQCGNVPRQTPQRTGLRKTLVLPYYQMNTAGRCTLRAVIEHGNRGVQYAPTPCPRYCEHACFLYPDHLEMAARWNSLFGFDREILTNSQVLSAYLRNGADHVAINLM